MDAPDEWQIMIKGTPAGMISALTMPGGRQVADGYCIDIENPLKMIKGRFQDVAISIGIIVVVITTLILIEVVGAGIFNPVDLRDMEDSQTQPR
ncbi:MAG TPA: hypothetical protein DDW45_01420 [Gammaproteobacteria bacterium]|nr:hypothetical protein [Gammaproteobacteria bacterium]